MVGTAEQSLFFVSVPELSKLCWVTVSLQQDENEPRNKQMKTCRELVLLYSDILACPALDSFSAITLIMATSFFKKGIIQAYGQRHNLQVSGPQSVLPGLLQCCVSYTLTCRLAPFWNKAGAFLISGKDFLTESGRMSAVCMQFSTNEKQLCVSVEVNTVRLPPPRLEDFDIPSMVLKNFWSTPDAVISVYSLGGNPWCYVLPSMKRGQIVTIGRQLNKDSPFRSYSDLQRHWNSLYGYRLPDLSEEEVIYCSVYFKPVGERLFTYPLSCIRLQPVECCSRLHQQGMLESFLCDITNTMPSVCGVPVRWTSKPRYHTTTLTSSASTQVLSGKAVNLSTQSSSCAVVLTQHPASSCTPHTKPSFGPQPPARPVTSLQPPGAQSCVDRLGSTGSTKGDLGGPTGSSSSTLSQASSFSILSPTPPPPPPPSHQPVNPVGPKLVPIFHNQTLKPHVNITLLLAHKQKKQQEQPGRGAEERQRVSLPSFRKNRPPTAASSPPPAFSLSTTSFSSSLSSSTSSAALPPPPRVPLFTSRHKSNGVSHAHPKPNPNRNPPSNPRPSPNPRPNPLSNPRPRPNPNPNPLSNPRPSPNPRPNPLSNPKPNPNSRPNPNPSPNSDPRSRAILTPTISNPRPSLNPRPSPKPSPISDPRTRPNFAPKSGSSAVPNPSSSQGAALVSRAEPQQDRAPQNAPPRALVPSDIPSNRGGDVFESKPKRPRPAVQDLDVEMMARNNQSWVGVVWSHVDLTVGQIASQADLHSSVVAGVFNQLKQGLK